MKCDATHDTTKLMWPGTKAQCQLPSGHDGWHHAKHVVGKVLDWPGAAVGEETSQREMT